MARINKSQFAILGMLSLSPMSGYEIRRSIERSTNHFWKESDGQLYPTLEKLVKEGKIHYQGVRKHGARESKVYELTEKGRDALERWLKEPDFMTSTRSELMLKVFFGANVKSPVIHNLILNFLHQQQQQLQLLQQVQNEIDENCAIRKKHAPYWKACLRLGELRLKATLQWCEEVLKKFPENL